MMSVARGTSLDAHPEEILDVVEDERGVVDGIDLGADELLAEGACHAASEIVDVELDFHGGVNGAWLWRKSTQSLLQSWIYRSSISSLWSRRSCGSHAKSGLRFLARMKSAPWNSTESESEMEGGDATSASVLRPRRPADFS